MLTSESALFKKSSSEDSSTCKVLSWLVADTPVQTRVEVVLLLPSTVLSVYLGSFSSNIGNSVDNMITILQN